MPDSKPAPVAILYPKPVQTLTKAFRGAATLAVGLVFVTAGAEALGFLNACAASAACLPYASWIDLAGALALSCFGVALAVTGAMVVVADLMSLPRIEAW